MNKSELQSLTFNNTTKPSGAANPRRKETAMTRKKETYTIPARGTTPDGIKIQIEDWRPVYDFFKTLHLVAYPVSKKTSEYGWIQSGKTMRYDMRDNWHSDEEVKQAFADLESGKIKLTDLKHHATPQYRDFI